MQAGSGHTLAKPAATPPPGYIPSCATPYQQTKHSPAHPSTTEPNMLLSHDRRQRQRHNPRPVPSEHLEPFRRARLPMIEGDMPGRCSSLTTGHPANAEPRRLNYRFCRIE
jgi:hypothetical protein